MQQNTNNSRKSDNTRIIAIASGKGGVGKTNISVNLGLLFQQYEMTTLLIDADFGMANADILLGITPRYNLSHIISGKCRFQEAILKGPGDLDILPGTSGADSLINMSSVAIKRLLATSDFIEENYDMVIVDVGAGIHNDVINFIKAADEVIIVMTPEPTSMLDAYSLIKVLNKNKYKKNINLLINQYNTKQEGSLTGRKLKKAVQEYLKTELKIIGHIPYDNKLKKAVKKQKPLVLVYPNSEASKALEDTASILLKNKKENRSAGMKGFIYKMVGFFTG